MAWIYTIIILLCVACLLLAPAIVVAVVLGILKFCRWIRDRWTARRKACLAKTQRCAWRRGWLTEEDA